MSIVISNHWVIPTVHNFDVKFKDCSLSVKVTVDETNESFETSLNYILDGSLTETELEDVLQYVRKKIMDNEILLPTLIPMDTVEVGGCEVF